ncbi:MalM family protein [Marinobacter sediminicola]|uniref:MalM family protein n=1 Tax=Marinobacter sediminicola TaxID=3072994 RepID=UPI0028117ACD|nr:MalM family protein [Marinobacter sp. F26243]
MNRHRFLHAAVCLILGAMLSACQIGGSTVSNREGYFSWVDEQGRVRYSPIVEEPAKEMPVSQSADADEFTTANYPDAEELRRRGYVREGDEQPYFTWRDADGTVRNTYYQPDTRTDKEKGFIAPPLGATPAKVYRAGDTLIEAEPVAGHDPDAFAILGIKDTGEDYLSRFSETCCETLDTEDHERWQENREFGVHLKDSSPKHMFLTGLSPYQLISLPQGDQTEGQLLRLRSYASAGVVAPSVLFLDGNLSPVRLVTDLVSDFVPENWHRRGYLEARIAFSSTGAERWMLVFTRSEDLEGQTVIETRRGPRKIPHVSTGEMGLDMVDALQ